MSFYVFQCPNAVQMRHFCSFFVTTVPRIVLIRGPCPVRARAKRLTGGRPTAVPRLGMSSGNDMPAAPCNHQRNPKKDHNKPSPSIHHPLPAGNATARAAVATVTAPSAPAARHRRSHRQCSIFRRCLSPLPPLKVSRTNPRGQPQLVAPARIAPCH